MIIYADVLFILNMYVNFFILKLTFAVCKSKTRLWRLILASLLGALGAFYILLPYTNFFTDFLFRIFISSLLVLVAVGFNTVKCFIRHVGVFFGASFLYAGAMLGLWAVFKIKGIAIKGSVVYMDISPVILIMSTLICYIIISVIRFFSSRHAPTASRCKLSLTANEKTVDITAIVDTGHSLSDAITGKSVIIIDGAVAKKLFEFVPDLYTLQSAGELSGFRVIPYSSVGGHGLLVAFSPQRLIARLDGAADTELTALCAITNEPLGEDYRAIISPEALNI